MPYQGAMDHDVYIVSQPGAQPALALMVLLTVAISAAAYSKFQWRGWWIVLLAAVLVPPLTSLAFARFRWPGSAKEYLADVVLPLALTVGAMSGIIGVALGGQFCASSCGLSLSDRFPPKADITHRE